MCAARIEIRDARPGDETDLAQVHRLAWLNAYSGILDGKALREATTRRNQIWWHSAIEKLAAEPVSNRSSQEYRNWRDQTRLLVMTFEDRVIGYANIGRSRRFREKGMRRCWGEIFELYFLPEFQGLGFGGQLFREARNQLSGMGFREIVVWSLQENGRALEFYRSLGGTAVARSHELFGGLQMPVIGFIWRAQSRST